jgi:hypothetical protein
MIASARSRRPRSASESAYIAQAASSFAAVCSQQAWP